MRNRKFLIFVITPIFVVIILSIILVYLKSDDTKVSLVHSTILNQYFFALDNSIISSRDVKLDIQVIQEPAALGTYLINPNQDENYVEAASVLAASAHEKNSEAKIVGSLLEGRDGVALVIVRADSDIQNLSDLADKRIGVDSLATTPTVVFRELLKQEYGIDYDQAKYITRPQPTLFSDIEKGDIDAALIFGVFAYRAKNSDNLRIISDLYKDAKELLGGYPISVVLATSNSSSIRQEYLNTALEIIGESFAYAVNNKGVISEELAGELGVSATEYENSFFGFNPTTIHLNEEDINRISTIIRFAYDQDVIKSPPDRNLFYGNK